MIARPGRLYLPSGMSDRPLKTDLWNGLRGKCPACGKGHMFRAFLKVADRCDACGEELHHQRADDFPAYLVIVIVGHLVVPLILHVEMAYEPAYWIHAVAVAAADARPLAAADPAHQGRGYRDAVAHRHARVRGRQEAARDRRRSRAGVIDLMR